MKSGIGMPHCVLDVLADVECRWRRDLLILVVGDVVASEPETGGKRIEWRGWSIHFPSNSFMMKLVLSAAGHCETQFLPSLGGIFGMALADMVHSTTIEHFNPENSEDSENMHFQNFM
jgi:hypothetical protein